MDPGSPFGPPGHGGRDGPGRLAAAVPSLVPGPAPHSPPAGHGRVAIQDWFADPESNHPFLASAFGQELAAAAFAGFVPSADALPGSYPPAVLSDGGSLPFAPTDSGYGESSTAVKPGIHVSHDVPSSLDSQSVTCRFERLGPADVSTESWRPAAALQAKPPELENDGSCDKCSFVCRSKGEVTYVFADIERSPALLTVVTRKHAQRHDKLHFCDQPGCPRVSNGFSTSNDLDRHKRSKHPNLPASRPRYRCIVKDCRHAYTDKTWPRADNFRMHMKKLHNIHIRSEEELLPYQCCMPEAAEAVTIPTDAALADLASLTAATVSASQDSVLKSPSGPWRNAREALRSRHATIHAPHAKQKVQPAPVPTPRESHPQPSRDATFSLTAGPPFHDQQPILGTPSPPRAEATQTAADDSGVISFQNLLMEAEIEIEMDALQHNRGSIPEALFITTPGILSAQSTQDAAVWSDPDEDGPLMNELGGNGHNSMMAEPLLPAASPDSVMGLPAQPAFLQPPDLPLMPLFTDAQALAALHPSSLAFGFSAVNDADSSHDEKRAVDALRAIQKGGVLKKLVEMGKGDELEAVITRICGHGPGKETRHNGSSPANEPGTPPSEDPKRYRCRHCSKSFNRKCELRKHQRRHERPYGCTYPFCFKLFGSKNDWKRHELGQHMQHEAWVCGQAACNKVSHRIDVFSRHVKHDHHVSVQDRIERMCNDYLTGRNKGDRFWCGLCNDVITLTVDRFDHIDAHLTGRRNCVKKPIREWNFNLVDGLRESREDDANLSDDETGPDVMDLDVRFPQEPAEDAQEQLDEAAARLRRQQRRQNRKRASAEGDADCDRRKKRRASDAPPGPLQWVCCNCNLYTSLIDTSDLCLEPDCGHTRCKYCLCT